MYLRGGSHVEGSCPWDVTFIFLLLALLFTALLLILLPEEQWLKVLLLWVCT